MIGAASIPPTQTRGSLIIRDHVFAWGQATAVMGIINVSPDSFAGDGFSQASQAVSRALQMIEDGADIIDVGGQSTRPGYSKVEDKTECDRVIPVIKKIRRSSQAVISIDTTRAAVLKEAVAAGADILNCVTLPDQELLEIAIRSSIAVVLTDDRVRTANERDVVGAIIETLRSALNDALERGLARDRIIIDPGIGFGKRPNHNVEILSELDRFVSLGFPILVGTSRKSFIGEITGRPVKERDFGTASTVAIAIAKGADMVRVHSVENMMDVVRVADSLVRGRSRAQEECQV